MTFKGPIRSKFPAMLVRMNWTASQILSRKLAQGMESVGDDVVAQEGGQAQQVHGHDSRGADGVGLGEGVALEKDEDHFPAGHRHSQAHGNGQPIQANQVVLDVGVALGQVAVGDETRRAGEHDGHQAEGEDLHAESFDAARVGDGDDTLPTSMLEAEDLVHEEIGHQG